MPALASRIARHARVALALLPLSLGAGCDLANPMHEGVQTAQVAHVAGSAIDVRSENGAIAIARSERDDVLITATLRAVSPERLAQAAVVAERRDDGTLMVSVDWPDGKPRNGEGCRFEIALPDAGAVTARSSNGAIKIEALSGAATLRTSNGAISAIGHDGPVEARTSNGEIKVSESPGPVDAESSNGSITVSLLPEAAGPVRIDTSNGSITLEVGRAFLGELSVETSNGSISLPAEGAARVVSKTKKSATLQFGTGGERSVLDTSNGRVTVRVSGI